MSLRPRDPLLAIGRIIVLISQAVMALGAFAAAIALPVVWFMHDRITAEMLANGHSGFVFPTLATTGLLILAFAAMSMAFLFFDRLRRMIDTVGEGDPFVPENGQRLTQMAWLTLGTQLLLIPAGGLALFVAKQFEPHEMTIDAGLDLGGITLIITLFILARVFRKGTEMREELEGTV